MNYNANMNYTLQEILIFIFGFLGTIVIGEILYYFLADKSLKTRTIPLKVITVIIVVLEIIKQIRELVVGYNLFAIPLHFCSLFVFLYPLACFSKGRFKGYAQTTATIFSLMVGIAYIFNPKLMIQDAGQTFFSRFGSFHTVVFHMLVYAYAVFSLFLNVYEAKIGRDMLVVGVSISIYWVIAIVASYSIGVNFNNVLKSGFPPFETFRQTYGNLPYLILIIPLFIMYGLANVYLYHLLNGLVNKRFYAKKRSNKKEEASY